MKFSGLKIGILHSLIGKNDGVSIVIDQTIQAMIELMDVPLGNIYLLAAHSPPRFNTTLDEIFWHKNEQNKYILANYSGKAPIGFKSFITKEALYAKKAIMNFVNKNEIDLLIIHNSCHPSNFVYAAAAGMYFEDLDKQGKASPKYLLWWHDSHYERERFRQPNPVIKSFLRYIPGSNVRGIVFINTEQAQLAKRYYKNELKLKGVNTFFKRKTVMIPNTCDIPWDWQAAKPKAGELLSPPAEQYNRTFLGDIGLLDELKVRGKSIDDTVIILQHTRIVQRKRIDISMEFAFKLEEKFRQKGHNKFIVLLVSGHSGDEHDSHLIFLKKYFRKLQLSNPQSKDKIMLLFAEKYILPEREVIVEKKIYRFRDIPGIVARCGGLGTYFSEVEGFGNNLLEMISFGLPVVINKYPIYKRDIEKLGFKLPSTSNCRLPDKLIEDSYQLIIDIRKRNGLVKHNLGVLNKNLHHGIVAERLSGLIQNVFKYK